MAGALQIFLKNNATISVKKIFIKKSKSTYAESNIDR